jgi:hypothetical protein
MLVSRTVGKVLIVLLAGTVISFFALSQSTGDDFTTALSVEVSKIKNESPSISRTEHAQLLAQHVRQNVEEAANGGFIALLESMLTDSDDSVRFWVAMALGYMGPRARQAVPTLAEALKEKECERPSLPPAPMQPLTSALAIRLALTQIVGSEPPKSECEVR